MKRLLIVLALMLIVVMPVQALTKIDPAMEWWIQPGNESDTNIKDLPCAEDGGITCFARGGSSYNRAMIKLTFPGGVNITEMRYYETEHADSHYLQNTTTWTYTPSEIVSGGSGTTYNAWGNVSIYSGKGFTPTAPLYYRGGAWWLQTAELEFWAAGGPAPIADFMGAPLNASAPAYVAFTDLSTNEYGTCTYNWSYTPTTGVLVAPQDLDNEDITMLFTENGNFTISHGVSCDFGSNISTKTDYIHILNSTAVVTTAFRATDGATGNRITGATIHLNDVENGSWSNSSTNLGVATITVLVGHHISAYATALGFEDGEYLNAPAMAWTYDIMMLPTGFANVSAGNVTAYITVTDADTLQKLYGAQVNALYATGEGSFILESQTNSAGVASFVLPNNTNVHFVGVKSGYESSQLVLNTGTGSGGDAHVEGELKMSKLTVTPTITQTTLPGGGTPTPTTTVLPGCEDLTTQDGKDRCNAAQGGEMMGFLYENGLMLITLCVAAMIFGLLGMIMKSF